MPELKVEPKDLRIIQRILRTHVPGLEVWAFGSRVHGENLKPFSDLDLVIISPGPPASLQMLDLKEAFTESDLPFKVDLLDWSTLDESFRKKIAQSYLVVQIEKNNCTTDTENAEQKR